MKVFTFKVLIRVETLARVISDECNPEHMNIRWSEEETDHKGGDSLVGSTEVIGYVGSSYDL